MISSRLKVVADRDIPFLRHVLEPYADIIYKKGVDISNADVLDADCLMVRTRTKCNKSLLENSKVKLIASATIGTDHIDLDYCNEVGIRWTNAQACNADAVMQYVFTSLYTVAERNEINLRDKTFGVIGVGSTGSRVARMAEYLGFKILLCDPPRAEREGKGEFCDLDYVLENSDIISLHLPLNKSTREMANGDFFRKLKPNAIFINTSRGEVMVDSAVIEARQSLSALIIDTWNNEPQIDRKLLSLCDIASFHIAGYSFQGKQNATGAIVKSFADYFDISELKTFYPNVEDKSRYVHELYLKDLSQREVCKRLLEIYPIYSDDIALRAYTERFEELRAKYFYRNEFRLI